MNTFDLVVIGLLLISGIVAFRRGFIKEIFSLGTWVAASVIAATYYKALQPWMMSHHIKNELAAGAASALALFGLTLVVLIPTGNMLISLIKGPTLTSIDRSMGFVFGLMRGLLILSLIYLGLSYVWPEQDEQPGWLTEARTTPLLADGADLLKGFVPKDEREKAEKALEEDRNAAEKAIEDAKHLDDISTPVPASRKDKTGESSYGDELRGIMDNLTNEKKKP
jgi:membrane protein required for colicin V production